MFLAPTDFREIDKIILNLRFNSASGLDTILPIIFRGSHTILCSMIAHICNLSFSAGFFPDICKKAVVVPVHKGGDVDSISNYRPISLLGTISKIIEKVFNTRNNIIAASQYGFRPGKNTEDAISSLTESITKNLDSGRKCVGIFLDLKKAFDTVSIPLLLLKLEALGIRGLALAWLRDNLKDRSQVVRVDKSF